MAGEVTSATSTPKTTTTSKEKTKQSDAVARATRRGTKIVKPGLEMDKNAFLRILSAELSHQDPTSAKDGTEYVTQMAQFTGLEQMANLNSNIKLTSATSFIGKEVMLNSVDKRGDLHHGVVTGVSKYGDLVALNVYVGDEKDEDGNMQKVIEEFNIEDVLEVKNLNKENSDDSNVEKNEGSEEKEV